MSTQGATKSNVFNPFGSLIGLHFTMCQDGQSRCVIEIVDNLFNPNGVVHGGVIYSLADTGMGAALYSDLTTGQNATTIEIKMSYFKPVSSGQLSCDTKIINRGRKVATLESEISNHKRLIAKAMGTFYIFDASPS